MTARLESLQGTVTAQAADVSALSGRIDAVTADVTARLEAVSTANAETSRTLAVLDDFKTRVEPRVESLAHTVTMAQAAIADKSSVFTRVLDDLAEMRKTIESAKAVAASIQTLTAKVDQAAAAVAQVPVQFAIDSAGDLVAFRADSSMTRIGHVTAKPAAEIADVEIVQGNLRFRMTDDRLHTVEIPHVADNSADDVELSDEQRASIQLDSVTASYAEIGQRYGISARKVAQVVGNIRSPAKQ